MPRYLKYLTGSGQIIGEYVSTDPVLPARSGMALLKSNASFDPDATYVASAALATRTRADLVGHGTVGGTAALIGPSDAVLWIDGTEMPATAVPCPAAGTFVYALHGRYVGTATIVVTPPDTPAAAQADGIQQIDDQARALSNATMTGGFWKAQLYEEQSREVVLYLSLKGAIVTLTSATEQFPALMAMVAEWAPEATTAAARLAALTTMVAKVEGGIAKSRPYLRRLNAIAVRGKEQLRAAGTAPAKRAVIAATITRLAATPLS